jgi:predicted nucleotidyltransferase
MLLMQKTKDRIERVIRKMKLATQFHLELLIYGSVCSGLLTKERSDIDLVLIIRHLDDFSFASVNHVKVLEEI